MCVCELWKEICKGSSENTKKAFSQASSFHLDAPQLDDHVPFYETKKKEGGMCGTKIQKHWAH